MRKIVPFLILFFLPYLIFSQNFRKIEKSADSYFKVHAYKAAIPMYRSLLEMEPSNPEVNMKLGLSYLETMNREGALKHLLKAYRAVPDLHPDMDYYLGRAYQLNYSFEDAQKHYGNYLLTGENEELKEKSGRRIEECKTGAILYESPVSAVITNIGSTINSAFDEYSPIVSPDESMMVFTSRRDNSTGGKRTVDGEYFEDIYQTFNVNGKWTIPRNIGKPVNSPNHDAAVSMSSDGKLLFIYYDQGGGDIYYSTFENEEWTSPYPMSKRINTNNYETHASLSDDGKTLFFTSDRPGGYGGLDIYLTKLNDRKEWGDPVNLGPAINTAGDEDSPFIHPDGDILYFSSDGHPGMGGFDIFKAVKTDSGWEDIQNLGYPINTTDDDIYFTISADNQHGYYASNALDGYGGKDIYIISMPEPNEIKKASSKLIGAKLKIQEITPIQVVKPVKSTNPITILRGKVLDAYSDEPLEAKLILKELQTQRVVDEQMSEENGDYIFSVPSGINYLLEVELEDYIFLSHGFNLPYSDTFQEVEQDVELFKVSIGSSIVLENIFFDTGKATLRPESEEELNRLRDILAEVKNIRIRISGHTDNTGDKVFNKTLSEKRAKTVMDYLVKEGISSERLEYAGFGMEKPIASNNTSEGRQMNRRTEFEIIEN